MKGGSDGSARRRSKVLTNYSPRTGRGLDCTMTVEKAVLAGLPPEAHLHGCTRDDQVRSFAIAIAQKHSRIAFPDDFVTSVRRIQQRIQNKHGRDSVEGRTLAALRPRPKRM